MSAPQLWELLPALHRVRDAEQGGALEALTAVMQREVDRLHDDVEQLYDDWFIETCQDWVVPYLGDLLGVRGLLDITGARRTQRGLVANTIAYRRRKGTAAVIEQLAADVTGWSAHAVEFFQLLGWTQHVNHVRLGRGGTVDVRPSGQLELTGGPFDTAARTAEVRHIDNARGRFNIPNVGVFVWRLASYDVDGVTPWEDPTHTGRHRFSPLGLDTRLFNRPRAETDIGHLAEEINVPGPLRRRPLHDELAAGLADDQGDRWLASGDPVFSVRVGTEGPLPPAQLAICDLGDPARLPPAGKRVAVDPVRGQLAVAPGDQGEPLRVSYSYGFSGDLGGGPYDRRESLATAIPDRAAIDWQRGVYQDKLAGDDELFATIQEAVDEWATAPAAPPLALIVVIDSSTYEENVTIEVPAGRKLVIAAARWSKEPDPLTGTEKRVERHFTPNDVRPHLLGSVTVTGGGEGSELVLDGLLIQGSVSVGDGDLRRLRLAHSTLVPPGGKLTVEQGNTELDVELFRCVTGPLEIGGAADELSVRDSIVDAGGGPALKGPAVELEATTVLGTTKARSLSAGDSIFTGRVEVERRQVGCVRHSYLPVDSLAPRRYRCRPETTEEAARIVPAFTSVVYGEAAYGQLSDAAPPEILTGADDEGEMGAFNFLQSTHRAASLRARLDEYLRFGLEAGIFHVT